MFLDLTKAFDCIDHQILLDKLSVYNFGLKTIDWFRSYLHDRWQSVCVDNHFSESGEVSLGVPQGSILGPLLFSLFINDLPSVPKHCQIYLYADDAVFFASHSSLDVVNKTLQEDLDLIGNWLLSNRLKLNVKKSVSMLIGSVQKTKDLSLSVTALGEPLANVTKTKYLGVFVDNHLKWDIHINHLKQCISSKIACLKRLFPLPKHIKLLLYRSYILSILDYCDCIWSSASDTLLKSLDNIHYRCLKSIDHSNWSSAIPPSLCLQNRRRFHIVLQSFKILKGLCPSYLSGSSRFSSSVTGRSSKNKYRVFVPYVRTNFGRNSFYFRAVSIWNSFPDTGVFETNDLRIFKLLYKLTYF